MKNQILFPISHLYSHLIQLVDQKLYARVLLGLVLGIICGILVSPQTGFFDQASSTTLTNWLAVPGNLFLRLIQMIMIPLVFASIIQGIAGGQNLEQLKDIGLKITIYFIITTVVAILIGVGLALLIEPGKFINPEQLFDTPQVPAELPTTQSAQLAHSNLPQRITNVIPSNPLQAMLSGEMLSIVLFSMIIGTALLSLPARSSTPMLELMFSVQEICMTVTRWAMTIAPFAVFGLISQITSKIGFSALTGLGIYILTVWLGLLLLTILYTLLIGILTQTSPRAFWSDSKDVLLLAFSMASSAAVIPLSLKTAEDDLKISPTLSRFIIPLGATINMNGTALYQAIATIFLAQVYGLELSLLSIALVITTTVAASIGTPSSPGAGIVILATVLSSVGIPVSGIALIIGVDHLLGMSRSAVNVAGDLTACVVFNHYYKKNQDTDFKVAAS